MFLYKRSLGFIVRRQPRQPFVESVARSGARRLNVPIPIPDAGETQFFLDLVGLHGVGKVLLVGEDEDDGVPHLPVVDDAVKLLPRLVDTVSVRAVHHEDEALRPRVVVPPEGPDLVLAAHVPHVELNVLVGDGLHVEAHGGDGGDRLAQLQFVEDGGLAGRVQAQHQDPHLLVAEDLGQHLAHGGGGGREASTRGGAQQPPPGPLPCSASHTVPQTTCLQFPRPPAGGAGEQEALQWQEQPQRRPHPEGRGTSASPEGRGLRERGVAS